jgi:ABC-2 type transport system ATP-binding protein
LFRGSPKEMIASVSEKVWQVTTDGKRPGDDVEIVSTIQTQNGVQYRVLGDRIAGWSAVPVEPNLEDGYIWLMQHARPVLNDNE